MSLKSTVCGTGSKYLSCVRLSVCRTDPPQQWRAAGLLLGAPRAGDIDRQRRAPGAQQQRRRSTGSQLSKFNADSATFTAAVGVWTPTCGAKIVIHGSSLDYRDPPPRA